MEGSDETGVLLRIETSIGNSVLNQGFNQSVNGGNFVQLGINGQLQNLSVSESNYGKRPVGIPPSHPHSYFGGGGAAAPPQLGGGGGGQHSRSLSQPSVMSFDQLPPLSPCMSSRESPTTSSDRVSNEVDRMEVKGNGNNVQGLSLPPRRGGHRRSSSDVPLGFDRMAQNSQFQFTPAARPVQLVLKREADLSKIENGDGGSEMADDLFTAYMNFDAMDALNSSSMDDKDSRASGTRTNESSENEVESSSGISSNSVERRAPGGIAPTGRHIRSLSMDSFMGNLNFNDESPRLPPSPGIRSAHHSPSTSMDGSINLFSMEFRNGEFSPDELRKIMSNEKLVEFAKSDPKRVKRILANRVSAARSKERKVKYISELEYKVQTLQTEATSLSTQLTLLQRDSTGIVTQNNELRFRLQSMQQQAQLRDALTEALTAEVQRLKMIAQFSGCLPPQHMTNDQVFQPQPSQYMHHIQQQQQQQQEQTTLPQNQQSHPKQSAESEQGTKARTC